MDTKRNVFEVYVPRLLENLFLTVFLTAEAQLAHCLGESALVFLGTSEFHGEFYEIEFYNSIQD